MGIRTEFIGLQIDRISFEDAVRQCREMAHSQKPAYACFANVHMLIESHGNAKIQLAVNGASLVLADGMPLAKGLSILSGQIQERIAGMDFIAPFLDEMDRSRMRLCIYGGTQQMAEEAGKKIASCYPGIASVQCLSPPFGIIKEEEEQHWVDKIREQHPHVVFTILGCPKQELFMAKHSHGIDALMLGLGGALPVFLGLQKRAPDWMRKYMLEWLYRLIQEPGRLWKRYFVTNFHFLWLFMGALLKRNNLR